LEYGPDYDYQYLDDSAAPVQPESFSRVADNSPIVIVIVINVVFGFGLGYHVEQLFERASTEALFCIFEPDLALLRPRADYYASQTPTAADCILVIEVADKVIGEIFLHHKHRGWGTTHFGIGIYDPEYVGKGYGRDALNVLLRWAFRIQGYRRVSLTVGANNERAIRAYQACGFVQEGRFREEAFYNGQYEDVLAMGLLRSEWEAKQAQSP